jgi:hypothetical protein
MSGFAVLILMNAAGIIILCILTAIIYWNGNHSQHR